MHADYSPAERVDVKLDVMTAEATPDSKPLRTAAGTTGGDGEAHIDIGALPPGAYRLVGHAVVDGRDVTENKTFVVRAEGRELEDVAARDKVLREIAQVGGGEYRFEDMGHLSVRSPREVRVGRRRAVELWSSPALLIAGIALLATEWYLRRRAGHS
jgi:hypothetical protein